MVQPSPLTYLNHDPSGSDLNHPGRSLFLASDVGGVKSRWRELFGDPVRVSHGPRLTRPLIPWPC